MIVAYLIVIIIAGVRTQEKDPLIVSLPYGKIRGHELRSVSHTYYAFQEIPYASPPGGNLRFKEPTPPGDWGGILNTTKNTKSCWQLSPQTHSMLHEDCLYLNVYTPKKKEEKSPELFPVFFWIPGGGFKEGEGGFGLYNPGFLMDHDIIVVTINYRLGPLGFLTTNTGVIPANLGLKDQIFALQWTKRNIHLFSGNPAKITIGGEGAGAASVTYLLLSKQVGSLFRGAIAQSGSSLCHWAHQATPETYAYRLGALLGHNITEYSTSEKLLADLQETSASDITKLGLGLKADPEKRFLNFVWSPVMEYDILGSAVVKGPMDANLESGKLRRVPILMGYNSEEYLPFLGGKQDPVGWLRAEGAYFDEDLARVIGDEFDMFLVDKAKAGRQIRSIYTHDLFTENPAAVLKFMSDKEFNNGVIRHAALHSKYADVYLYEFSYVGSHLYTNLTIEGADRVGHIEELPYLWYYPPNKFKTKDDTLAHNRMLRLWTNFIKYLNPTPTKDELLGNVIWPKLSPTNLTYLNINRTLNLKTGPKHYEEWKSIIDAYVIPPLINY